MNLAADQQVEISSTQAGTYYILAYAEAAPDAPASFTLTAATLQFQILGLSNLTGGNGGKTSVVVRGAADVDYQHVVGVLDVLQQVDITKVGLATEAVP